MRFPRLGAAVALCLVTLAAPVSAYAGPTGPVPNTTAHLRGQATVGRTYIQLGSTIKGSTFRCALNNKVIHPCTALVVLKCHPTGDYVLRATATSPGGKVDPTPAVLRFHIGSAADSHAVRGC